MFRWKNWSVLIASTLCNSTWSGFLSFSLLHIFKYIKYILHLKGIVHPLMEIHSSFTHPHAIPNLDGFLSHNTNKDILRNVCTIQHWPPFAFINSLTELSIGNADVKERHRHCRQNDLFSDLQRTLKKLYIYLEQNAQMHIYLHTQN